MGDMSRVFSIGKLPEKAYVAHQVCLDIQEAVVEKAKPGAVCEDLYNLAIDIVTKAGFADNFMGATQKAKFIGHGIGLEINENAGAGSTHEAGAGTGHGLCFGTEDCFARYWSRRYRKLLGCNSGRSGETDVV